MAYLEGKAKEIRAATEARVKLISTSGDKIAEQVDVPIEYAQAAVKRYGQKIVRERINIDNICEKAANQISAESGEKEQENSETEQKETANSEINSDWLNKFEDVSGPVSTDEMQNRLSRILAGEIQQPGSFSVKTLKLVGDLDSAVLSLFQKLCSMAISLEHTAVGRRILDVRVLSLGGNAGANSLSPYGMSFSNLNILHEYGLVIPDFNSYFNYAASIAKQADKGLSVVLPFKFQGELKGLRWKDKEQEIPQQLRLHGVGLSTSGKELFSVMDLEAAPDYRIALTNFFNSTGYEILTVAI